MHGNSKTGTTQQNHNTNITWFTPSVGATSTNCVLFLFPQNHSLSVHSATDPFNSSKLRTKLQIFAHTTADLLNHPKPSAYTAAEVVHAHSWELTFLQDKP